MPGFWDYLKGLFREAEQSSPSKPLIHEMIERSVDEKQDFQFWKETLVKRRLVDWLNDQYAVYQVLPEDIDESLDFLDTPSSKGFVIHLSKTGYNKRDSMHFFDYLKEQVLQMNYRTQISDVRTYNRSNWVETVQRHYLKPRSNFQEGSKFDQQYGNIMIELQFRNDRVYNLKFSATCYKDHMFKDAGTFKDLMKEVLI